jgi:hypothetical protein
MRVKPIADYRIMNGEVRVICGIIVVAVTLRRDEA